MNVWRWLVLLGVGWGVSVYATSPLAPVNLRVCDVVNPVGTGASPFFGWFVNDPDENEIQTAYQIRVVAADKNGVVWDSGAVRSGLQNHVVWGGPALKSDTQYFWQVRTWDKDGEAGDWSVPALFAVGLLENADWDEAEWIRRDSTEEDDYTRYRKKITVPQKTITRATVYISAVHKYALYLNGALVGKGPAYHYPQYQYYNAFDITAQLKSGAPNQFAVFTHWFGGGQGRATSERGMIAKVVIHYADGSSKVIGTDGSWKQKKADAWSDEAKHRNRGEGVGYIETIDGRKLEPDWTQSSFDDSSWKSVSVIGAHPVAPWTGALNPDLTRIEEHEIEPASIISTGDGSCLIDLGKVYAGVPRIQFSGGKSGEKVEMLGGYALDSEGRINPQLNQSADLHFYALLNGKSFVFEPVEYVGMRYLEIKNAPMPVTKDNCRFVVRYNAMDLDASAFESSDKTLNAVWALMKHSLTTCAQEEFVDTPTREKGGFLGDAAIQSTVAMPVMNERALTERALKEYLQSMDQYWAEEGRLNAVYPNRDGGRDIPDFTQAYLVWVWNYYLETGDLDFLSKNYDHFKAIGGYLERHLDKKTGLIADLTGGKGPYEFGIVDWPASMRYGYDMVKARTVMNGWAYADFSVLSKIAQALGDYVDSTIYQERADALAKALNQTVLKDGVYVDGLGADGTPSSHVSQHANIFPLALGFVPEAQRASVIEAIKERKMSVGMVVLPWLIRAIGESGDGAHLVELFTNEQWDGWAQCLAKGATCTWESWDAARTKQSLSHAWGTSGLEGYVRYILGIRILEPQYARVLIAPIDCGSRLTWARGRILTDRGMISVQWSRGADSYKMNIEIPANITASISLPVDASALSKVLLDGQNIDVECNGGNLLLKAVGSGAHSIEFYASSNN